METEEKASGFPFRNHQGRASDDSTAVPIWANGSFKPVRIMLLSGKTELLLRMDIVKKLDIAVCFAGDRFHVGQGGGK